MEGCGVKGWLLPCCLGGGDGGFPVLWALRDEEEHADPRDALVIQDVGDHDDAVGVDLELGFLGGVEFLVLALEHPEGSVEAVFLDEGAVVPSLSGGG